MFLFTGGGLWSGGGGGGLDPGGLWSRRICGTVRSVVWRLSGPLGFRSQRVSGPRRISGPLGFLSSGSGYHTLCY